MHGHDFDLVCIGSGPAGQRAAIQAAKLGKRVAVVERQRCAGGVCVETGTIPSKTFREAVRRVHARCGLESNGTRGHERTRPTMQQLVGHVSQVIQREIGIVEDVLARNDVQLVHGRAFFESADTLIVDSADGRRRLKAAHTLIAVGTTPSKPRGIEPDGEIIMTSDTVLNMRQLPRTMAVVGAGVIGIEYASMFAALGVQVTVIDQRPRALEFLDGEIVDEMVHQLRKSDVIFRCGDAVEDIEVLGSGPRQALLRLASGKHLVADVVLFSAGRVGATADLCLGAAGLEADERGRLMVDDRYRTRVETIWAAGDVIGFPALAATSSEQGRLAACAMFGVDAKPMGNNFPVGIYAIPEVSMVGVTEEALTRDKIPYETGIARYKEISRGSIVGDDSGMFKMLFHRDDGRLLGCHCIGSGATELIHVGQAVLGLGGGLDYFLTTVFNYPTLAECYKVAAHNAANKLALVRRAQDARASVLQFGGKRDGTRLRGRSVAPKSS
ncbi:MAG: Si-specific NAD(P)(+) transhydrogenase [Betaproteobacteria bacterium]|nr:MAG: Si-specific NAD(P)(+) transhydrogenase [Betaproteobacteria bacterium]RPI48460.1 MAG: Si-specific NAD(P)(+) transhydrogenase [Betaproteobacteria bacterium]